MSNIDIQKLVLACTLKYGTTINMNTNWPHTIEWENAFINSVYALLIAKFLYKRIPELEPIIQTDEHDWKEYKETFLNG